MRSKWLIPLTGCLLVLVCVVLAACGFLLVTSDVAGLASRFLKPKELTDVQATLEAVAPTVQAAATSALPTKAFSSATLASPTQAPGVGAPSTSGSGDPFANALTKAKSATKYRVQFSWVFGGTENGKYNEQSFIDFTGEVDGNKSHMTSKGGLLAMLAQDANTPLEIIDADNKTYMKGVSMFGMTDPKSWYITDDSSTSSFADFAKPDEFNSWTSGTKAGDIKKVRSESLDGQACDVYVYDMKSQQNSALSGLLGLSQDKNDFSAVDKGETDFWLCADGFVHKFVLDYEGHDTKDATQKGALKMTWHAWDFNNAGISVQAPKDAKPMPK
ncbi:MAG: hypothetical protein ACM3S0_01040 [Acidobacteriota bacterium]